MATYITDSIVSPQRLTGYVRDRVVLTGVTLESILPARQVDDLEFELENLDAPTVQVARYRAWDTAPPLGKRPGFAVIRGEIAPMGLSMRLNEKELARFLRLRNAQPSVDGGRDIYDDAANTALACLARYELARADLLLDGKVTIDENGFTTEADFGVPGSHLVTPATAWTDHTNSVPATDLVSAEALYRTDNGGQNPDGWLASDAAIADLALNAQLRGLVANQVGGGVPGILNPDQINTALRLIGVKAPIVPFNGQIPDLTGTIGPTLPVRKVIAVRQGMGETLFGTSPSAQTLVGQNLLKAERAPGIVSFAVEGILPAGIVTTSEAVGLPILRDPKALFVLTV